MKNSNKPLPFPAERNRLPAACVASATSFVLTHRSPRRDLLVNHPFACRIDRYPGFWRMGI